MTRIIARTSRRLRLSQSQRGLGLVGGLAVLVMIGTVLLLLPVSGAGRALTWNEALFTAVSAVATTGMTIITPGVDLSLFGQVVLLSASLSFIGLGARPPSPEWGAMITEGATNFYDWWVSTAPGIVILLGVLAFNFDGDALRVSFDVKADR